MDEISRSLGLLRRKFGLEGLGHFRWRRTRETHDDLDRVVDEPLEGGEGTDHDDPRHQAGPQALHSKLLGGADRGTTWMKGTNGGETGKK